MQPINLKKFEQSVNINKLKFKRFLTKVEKNKPKQLLSVLKKIDEEIWATTDCLSCGNCCKKMTPTFTETDVARISKHLSMTDDEFKAKWLYYQKKEKDWVNVKQPCQFIDKKTNMCSIYEVRPDDCAGFPHLTKSPVPLYIHVHKQNIAYCPATYKMVEKLMEVLPK